MAQIGQTLTNLQNYNDEINVPTISAVGHTGQYSDILNPPVISTIGHTGQYTDVLNPPVISTAGHTGQLHRSDKSTRFEHGCLHRQLQ